MGIMLNVVPVFHTQIGFAKKREQNERALPRQLTPTLPPETNATKLPESAAKSKQSERPLSARSLSGRKTAQAILKNSASSTNSDQQLKRSLTMAGMKLLTDQLVVEVRRVLREQQDILPLLESSREWALKTLNRQYFAIRSASEMLKQSNMAIVAGRAEVLVCMLSQGLVDYSETHGEILRDTLELLTAINNRVDSDGSDKLCFSTARTALCLYAAGEPETQNYAPAARTRTDQRQHAERL